MQYLILVFAHVLILFMKVSNQCSKNLCFTWGVTMNELTLKCRVDYLVHKVYIIDQFGRLQADCLPPFPNVQCAEFYGNGTISQNPEKNETIYVVHGHIDDHLNGNWTCRHGLTKDVANVEVTIFKPKDITTSNCNSLTTDMPGSHCTQKTLLLSLISYFLLVMVVMIALAFVNYQIRLVDALIKICFKEKWPSCERVESVYRIKTVLFWFLTLGFFGVIVAFTRNSKKTCKYKYVFPVIGSLFGLVISCLCLGSRGKTVREPAERTRNNMELMLRDSEV